jgi:transglutaminase-like putative cysteine protease
VTGSEGHARTTAAEPTHFLVAAYRALRPREGYAVVVLAVVTVICLPAAALAGGMIVGLGATPGLAVMALLSAWWLAHRRIRGIFAAALLALEGMLAVLGWGVYVMQPWPVIRQGFRWLAWWLQQRTALTPPPHPPPSPSLDAFTAQGQALAGFGQRVAWWVAGLVTGKGVPDNLVLVAFACLLAWGSAAWAGWWLARNGKPFVALLPSLILLSLQVFWAQTGTLEILIFLGSFTMLLVLVRLVGQTAAWERTAVDYSPEIRLDTWLSGLAITWLVVLLAPTLPFLTSHDASAAFWRLIENPYRQVEQQVSPSFASVRPGRSLIPPGGISPGGLPRAHLLGGQPELARTVALRVRLRSPKPDEQVYWRGQTFATYTGFGWEEDPSSVQRERFAAGEPWAPDQPSSARHPVLGVVTASRPNRVMLFAAGEPVSVDRPYWAEVRGPGDLVSLGAVDQSTQYTIVSSVPDMDAAVLRAAGQDYPLQIAATYLQLPADLPAELTTYAKEITAAAPPTPYDRAVAIEAALRRLPYTLNVPTPPPGREVTSWFLFDLKQGYCDYFATAMVVLARLNGIPARLAIGYTMGQFDPQRGEYVVTEANAHSWPELYFPGQGWIPFEPTSGESLPARTESAYMPPDWAARMPDELASQMGALRTSATENAAMQRKWRAVQVIGGVACGLLLWLCAAVLIPLLTGRAHFVAQPGPAGELGAAYDRLLRWGGRLGRPPRPGDTPREYAVAVASAATGAAARASFFQRGALRAADIVRSEATRLALDFEAAAFGPDQPAQPPSPATSAARRAPLWPALRRLWLARVTSRPNVGKAHEN